jgi:hypothetical protein
MGYKMRFVQTFNKSDSQKFLELEHNFIELEKNVPEMKCGRRFVPVIGMQATNTMIWEAEYDTMEEAVHALAIIEGNSEHDRLLDEQIQYMRDGFVEIYKELV